MPVDGRVRVVLSAAGSGSAAIGRMRQLLAVTVAVIGGVLAMLATSPVAHAANGAFRVAANYPAGGFFPQSVAVGDFNADGRPDLAVAITGNSKVAILLGASGGVFGAATTFTVGNAPNFVATGDFNADLDLDLAFSNDNGGNIISVMLGGSAGTFGPGADLGTASFGPIAVAVGDFNADGDPDLAVANNRGANVSIFLGGSGGTFGAATNFNAGNFPESLAVGNFNADTDPDLAVANSGDDNVSILLGGSGGTFGPPTNFSAGESPAAVAVGDFNADGDPDLAVANRGLPPGGFPGPPDPPVPDDVSILLGGSGGTFGGATNFGVGDSPSSVAVGDFNADGDPDLAVANANDDNVSILLGASGGDFGLATNVIVGNFPQAVAVGDLNGDTDPDLAVANFSSADISVLLGDNAEHILTVTTSGAGSGTVTGTGISCRGPNSTGDCVGAVPPGTVVELTATPAANATFDTFTGAGCTASPCSVTMDAAKSVNAKFDLKRRTLTVTTSGSGSGIVTGAGISCGPNNTGDCSATADDGTTIVLTAGANASSTFDTFAGAACTTSPCSVTLDADKSVDASFAPKRTLTVTTSGAGSGTVTGPGISCGPNNTGLCSVTVDHRATIVLTANPSATSTFATFAGAGCTTSPCIVTLDADKSVDAKFDVAQRTLSVTTSGQGSGTVTGGGISCGPSTAGDCSVTVDHGTVIVLAANPAANSKFDTFAGAGCTTSPCSVTMNAAQSVDANFDRVGAPTATIAAPASGMVVAIGSKTLVKYSCTFPGSSISACTANVERPSGSVIGLLTGDRLPAELAGTHTITVTATNVGGLSNTATRTYLVAAPPTAAITAPASGTVVALGSKLASSYVCGSAGSKVVSCAATATGPGGSTVAPVGSDLPTTVAGTYTLAATARDALGQTTTVTRTYVAAAPPTATITTPANQGYVSPGAKTAAAYACASAASTVTACSATIRPPVGAAVALASGSEVPSDAKGVVYTIAVTATDALAQKTTTTSTYTVAQCIKKAAFALVEITTDGCMSNEGTAAVPQYETTSPVKVNGIPMASTRKGTTFYALGPSADFPGGLIRLDAARIRLDDFTAHTGNIFWKLPAGQQGDEKQVATLKPSGAYFHGLYVSGSTPLVFGFDKKGRHYATLGMELELDSFETGPGTSSPSATAKASLRVDDEKVHTDGLLLKASDVWLGPLGIESLCLSYVPDGASQAVNRCPAPEVNGKSYTNFCSNDASESVWDGSAVVTLPTRSSIRLALFGGFSNGRISNFGGIVDHLGDTVPLFSGPGNASGPQYDFYLSRIGVAACLQPPPYKLKGTVGVAILPLPGRDPTIGIDGSVTYTSPHKDKPWSLAVDGEVAILGQPIGSAGVTMRPTGLIEFYVQLGLDIGVAKLLARLSGDVDIRRKRFNLQGKGEVCVPSSKCVGGEILVSSFGIAGCVSYKGFQAGAGYEWGGKPDAWAFSCDLDNYRANTREFTASAQGGGPLASGLGYAAGMGATTAGALGFTVPAVTPALTVKVHGNGAPPSVVLRGPRGETISGSGYAESPGKWILLENPQTASTSVLLMNPGVGAWTVSQGPGPVAPTSIQTAGYIPPPAFDAVVLSGSRRRKALRFEYATVAGENVSIIEEGKVVGDIAGKVNGRPCGRAPRSVEAPVRRCATVKFTPTDGPGGKRDLYALVTRANGMLRAKKKLASYVAPAQLAPSRPRGLRMRRTRSRTGVIVSWRPSRPAASQVITVALSSGARFGVQTKRCSSLLIKAVPRTAAVDVEISGLRADKLVGPAARVRLAGGKTKAGEQGQLKRRTCRRTYDVAAR